MDNVKPKSDCPRCGGTGWYMYDYNHNKPCELCCAHDKGWWKLTKYYDGYRPGEKTYACTVGCGTLKHELKKK